MKQLVQVLALASLAACLSPQSSQDSSPKERASIQDPYLGGSIEMLLDPLFYAVPFNVGFAQSGSPLRTSSPARVQELGPNRFEVELEDAERVQAEQEGPEWCWAACALMVNRFSGRKGEKVLDRQEELARYFRGDAVSQAANLATIMRAITPDLDQAWQAEMPLMVIPDELITQDLLIEKLSLGEMVVVGLNDGTGPHACVAFGAVYGESLLSGSNGAIEAGWVPLEWQEKLGGKDGLVESYEFSIESVKIFDPYPGVGVRGLSGAEFAAQCRFLVSHSLVKDLLVQSAERRREMEKELDVAMGDMAADLFK